MPLRPGHNFPKVFVLFAFLCLFREPSMTYERRVLHYAPGPGDFQSQLSDRAIAGCWFELHRRGGCGAGELILNDNFPERTQIEVGDWIAFEAAPDERWYLGRVEHRQATSPAKIRYRLEGMGVELAEVFPGGFSPNAADGVPPHRYARTDLFPDDPDYAIETVDSINTPEDIVRLLMQQYVVPATHITYDSSLVETFDTNSEITSLKFRGEESVRTILKELALRVRDAAWGVRADGKFFFLQNRSTLLATWREGRDLLSLEESRDREFLINRVVLTGDYVYRYPLSAQSPARGFYRWRGNYIQPQSRAQHGERRLRVWIPWIRSRDDSVQFIREFFRIYAQPTSRFLIEVAEPDTLPLPWDGVLRIEARDGSELFTGHFETLRVQFDHIPRFRIEIGPEDPRTHWPEPPQDERWEIPAENADPGYGGDMITLTFFGSSSSEDSFDSETMAPTSFSLSDSDMSSSSISSDSATSDFSSSGTSSESSTSDSDSDGSSSDGNSSDSESSLSSGSDSSDAESSSLSGSSDSSASSSSMESSEVSGTTSSASESDSSNDSMSDSSDDSGSSDNSSSDSESDSQSSGDDSSSQSNDSDSSGSGSDSQSSGISSPCCPGTFPETLHATVSSSNCACANTTVPLTYNPTSEKWESGDFTLGSCGTTLNLKFFCGEGTCPTAGAFRLAYAGCYNSSGGEASLVNCSCDPLDVAFSFTQPFGDCCNNGSYSYMDVVVTE